MTNDQSHDIRALLEDTITQTRDDWLYGNDFDAADINSGAHPRGCCSDFVSAVYARFGGPSEADDLGVTEIGIDGFMVDRGDGVLKFDRGLIERHWKQILPPQDLSWDDLDRLAEDASFNAGTHEWMMLKAEHYDAECPQGVSNFFDLPFFRRVIASWLIDGPSARFPSA
jgi:hypothetical protein